MLLDDYNWQALSEVSGENFYVFAVKPKKALMQMPTMPKGMIGMMIPIFTEPNENKGLFEHLEIESTKDLPLLFVFTKVGPYLLKTSIKINESNSDFALEQLKGIFYKIRDVTKDIHSEYHEHDAQVHDKVAVILQKHKIWTLVKTVGGLVKEVKSFS